MDLELDDNTDFESLVFEAILNDNMGDAEKYSSELDLNNGESFFHLAAACGRTDVIEKLMQNGETPHVTDSSGQSILFSAANHDQLNAANYIINVLKIKPDVANHYGFDAIYLAVSLGLNEMVELMAPCVSDINKKYRNGTTLLNCAVSKREIKIIKSLIEKHKADPKLLDNNAQTVAHTAAELGYTDVLQYLKESHSIDLNVLNAFNKSALRVAASKGRIDTVKYLLSLHTVRNQISTGMDLAANHNALLNRAAIIGDLDFINLLLTYPSVYEKAACKQNMALTNALKNNHQGIANRLLEIPSVQEKAAQDNSGVSLLEISQDNENAMRPLDNNQLSALNFIKNHYKSLFNELGLDAILANLSEYLRAQYEKAPAEDSQSKQIEFEYNAQLSEKDQSYLYKNIYHTAWRYIFAKPNPWMSKKAKFVSRDEQGQGQANITDNNLEDIAYLWLAASDTSIIPINNFTHESLKEHYVRELALMGRAHNWDNEQEITDFSSRGNHTVTKEYDDMEGDKPTCLPGISQHLVQSVIGNPITQSPYARPINAKIIYQIFKEQILSDSKEQPECLHAKINALDISQLQTLKEILHSKVYGVDPLSASQENLLNIFKPTPIQTNELIEFCKNWFSKDRIFNIQHTKPIKWQDKDFVSYLQLINYFSDNVTICYFQQLNDMLETALSKKQNKQRTLLKLQSLPGDTHQKKSPRTHTTTETGRKNKPKH